MADTRVTPDGPPFDLQRLEAYCANALPGVQGPLELQKIIGGSSNPTFILTDRQGLRYVLRKKPPGQLLATAHQVEREYRVMKALQDSDVPVPRMLALCADAEVIGTAFYLMEHVDGRIFRDATLPGSTPGERGAIYDSAVQALAQLHRVNHETVGLADFGRAGNFFERQFLRWEKQYRSAQTDDIAEMEELIALLPSLLPKDASVSITHGDFRLENIMFHATEPRVVAVLDWELSTIGHPLSDLGYLCVQYHTLSAAFGTLADIDLARAGIPDQNQLVAAYCRKTGRESIDDLSFYIGFALFRLASIAQGGEKRRREGVNPRSKPAGAACVDWARHALRVLQPR